MQAYSRMYNLLKEQIFEGFYASGQKLPPERKLCEAFGVSRITARHAIRLLVEQGLIERFPGRGTYVRSTKAKKLPILNTDFAGSIRNAAPNLKRELLTHRKIQPPCHIAQILGLLSTEQCLLAERIDLLDAEALAYDRAFIPLAYTNSITPEMLIKVDFLSVWLEEEKLIELFGDEYKEYCNSVPRLFPGIHHRYGEATTGRPFSEALKLERRSLQGLVFVWLILVIRFIFL